ncbi:MAG: folate family ECF transporter S component [Butyrivibrio sp.]|nr:folate family ECF transporter S component [Butyrivibrio sp.]
MEKLRNTKTLAIAGMLTAIGIILGLFKIPINKFIEIRFGSLPIGVAGMYLGPGIAGIVGALIDIGGFIVKPTGPYFPGFTISGIISGIIYGVILYKKELTIPRVIAAEAIHTLIVGIFLNTYWLDKLYFNNGFYPTLMMRLPKELIMLPFNIIFLYIVLQAFGRVKSYAKV